MQPDPHLPKRRSMVEAQIRRRGVTDERVLAAMEEIPRERFVVEADADAAFNDSALPIACGQTISQPFMVASMTAHLEVRPEHRVLEVGTGSGYQTAILARLGYHVFTIERLAPLQEAARERLASLGIHNVSYRVGDGTAGWPEEAPFDRIMVTAGAPEVPRSLLDQLIEGGRMVIPVGDTGDQILTVVERLHGKTRETPGYPCRFVKLIGAEAWADRAENS